MKNKILQLLLLFTIAAPSIYAQEYLGLRQSNFSGIMGSDLNPASIADSRFKVDVLIFGGALSAYNNHMYFNTSKMPHWWTKSFNSKYPDSQAWLSSKDLSKLVSVDSTNYYKQQGKGQLFEIDNGNKNRSAIINTEFDVFNFMITIDRKRAIGFQIRNRTIFNLDAASPELVRLASNNFNFKDLFNTNIADEKINLSMNSWIEYNLSYAQVLSDKGQHFFKVGGKLKFLQGVSSFYFNANDLNFNIKNDSTANSLSANFDYGYSENLGSFVEPNYYNKNANEGFKASDIKDFASKLGLGIDIGVVYEWRPNWKDFKYDMDGKKDLWMRDKNKYKLRVGVAINDIGGMNYNKGGLSNNFSLNVNLFDLQKFNNTKGFRSLDSTLQNFSDSGFVTLQNNDNRKFYMNLPTHSNIDIDYHIYKNFYANFYTRINLKFGKDRNTVHYPTSFAVTPRFDHRKWGVSVPLSYNGIAGFRTGLALRLWFFDIGTGDLKPLIAPGRDMNIRGVDIYFAARIPILFKAPKDRDKDGVSDKLDDCIDIPGTWEMRGCSDVDHDGVLDQNDSCVTDSGLVKFNGCPDTDGDGIMDKEDDCPEVAGIAEFHGCPDTDGDGLMDKNDSCPTFPGPKENNGCPYKLLYSISDMGEILAVDTLFNNKKYYHFANLKANESHLFKFSEPIDEQSIKLILGNDTVTAYRNEKGYFFYQYLPPVKVKVVLMKAEEKILKEAFDNLEFETGKAIIRKTSYHSLEKLANLLIRKPSWKIQISGHTDSQGKAASNLKLSEKRAKAVTNFLILNNVLKERIITEWFGETQPIATNKTKAGRQKNRRVEMKIL